LNRLVGEAVPGGRWALYGTARSSGTVILAAKAARARSTAEQQAARGAFLVGATRELGELRLLGRAPGRLGGTLGCGAAANGTWVCLSVDSSATVAVLIGPKGPGEPEQAALLRDQVEHRS
jgi:hypothetical protein